MTNLILVHHEDWNAPLKAEGLVRRLGKLELDAVFTSPEELSIQTAENIAQAKGLVPTLVEEMRVCDTQRRIVVEMDRICSKHEQGTVAVVSHGDPIRWIIAHYLGVTAEMLAGFEISPLSVSWLEFIDGQSRLTIGSPVMIVPQAKAPLALETPATPAPVKP